MSIFKEYEIRKAIGTQVAILHTNALGNPNGKYIKRMINVGTLVLRDAMYVSLEDRPKKYADDQTASMWMGNDSHGP